MSKRKNRKTRSPITAPLVSPQTTLHQLSPPAPRPQPTRLRGILKLGAKIVGGLAMVPTIAAAGGYAMEKWNETKAATVDFVGEIDQKKPFTIPLSIKNPSSIFSMHSVVMSCDVTAYYSDKDTHRLSLVGGQLPTSGAIQISPGEVQNYWCDYPDKMIYTAAETGTVIPLESAVMTVHLSYETWIPWAITHDLSFEFTLFVTTGGMRWVKGKWVT